MTRVVVRSRVGPDGVLHLDLPIGPEEANREVRVIVEGLAAGAVSPPEAEPPASPPSDQESWEEFVRRTAGSITDPEFRRPDQGTLEERDPL